MITKITSIEELKQIFIEILLNKTDKVSDISDESVLNGIAYGCAKMAQRLLTNQAVVESHIFADTAYGDYLDEIATIKGISERVTSLGSSTYVRVEADPGTIYSKSVVKFTSSAGIQFIPEEDLTVDENGYGYIKVRSVQTGATSNVDALTINTCNNAPDGHLVCTNEYKATGGRDDEADDTFRMRIKESINQLARNTLSYLEQIFMKINNKVLCLHKGGTSNGKLNLIVVSTNGQDFTDDEFNELLSKSEQFLSLTELLTDKSDFALNLQNVNWIPVDVDFRVNIDESYDQDGVRRNIQIAIAKLFDYRFWKYGDKVEWENMLYAVKNIDGVRYVPDTHFYPQTDINVPKYQLPRLRGFIMRDLDGNILADNYNVLADFNYPSEPDQAFQSSVLSSIKEGA